MGRKSFRSAAKTAITILFACCLSAPRLILAQSYITTPTATAIPAGASFTINSTAATFSELGWDLTLRDHSASTGSTFYTQANGNSGAIQANTPFFTTVGGYGISGTATRQPFELENFGIGIGLKANRPTLVTLWVDTLLTSSIAAQLNDGSATLSPMNFTAPTKFQFIVNSTVDQSVYITSAKSAGGRVGLWATATSAAIVPEPPAFVLAFAGLVALAVFGFRRRACHTLRVQNGYSSC